MHMNGHHGPVPPADGTTAILVKMSGQLGEVVSTLRRVERRLDQPSVPAWETMLKAVAPYVILPLVAWATGSWQIAVEIAQRLASR